MDLPTGNFFQVTINSNKLFSFIDDIFKQLKTQEAQIASLSSKIHGMVTSVQQQSKSQAYSYDIELEKMRKGMQQEVNYMRLFMRDVDKKATERLSQVDNAIILLKDMIVKNKAQLEDDMAIKYSYLDKKIGHIPLIEEQQSKINKDIQEINIKISDFKDEFKAHSSQQQSKLKKTSKTLQFLIDKVNQTELDLKQETENITSMRNSFMTEESSRSRRKQKSKQNQNQHESFSNIINKIDEVESKLTQENLNSGFGSSMNIYNPRRSIISNNKIVRSGTNLNGYPKSGFAKKQNQHGKLTTFQSAVIQKLSKLQTTSLQKLDYFQKQLFKFSNKAEIVDEHIGILSRKLQKQKFKIEETAQQVKHFEERKIDERAIENVKTMIKKLAKDVEESIELKVDKQTYEKDKSKLNEKLYFLNENVSNKAEKSQVKKGLTFFQEKIRQIIIVLADERGVSQDGAVKKTPFKCLSCDKDLEAQQTQKLCVPIPSNTRCNTQQMRKRIRMINNTMSSINQDD